MSRVSNQLESAIQEMISPRINELTSLLDEQKEETDDRFERLLEVLIQISKKPDIVPSPS